MTEKTNIEYAWGNQYSWNPWHGGVIWTAVDARLWILPGRPHIAYARPYYFFWRRVSN